MRFALVALALLCVYCQPAYALVCPDGYSKAATLALCPATLSNLGVSQVTATSAQVSGETNVQGRGAFSRIYVSTSIYPSGCSGANVTGLTFGTAAYDQAIARCARADLIRAATGASATASETLVDYGYHAQTVTGLAPVTQYYAHKQLYGGGCNPYPDYLNGCTRPSAISMVKTIAFTTPADAGGGAPGEQLVADGGASARFIGNGGSDLADGLTFPTKWANPSKISCGLPAGTNIGFVNTSVFSGASSTTAICYDSTSVDWAIVGSVKLNGSSQPVWAIDGIRGATETDQKAKFLGPITQGCIDARNCDYRVSAYIASGLSSIYQPRVSISGNYIEFRNVEFEKSIGYDFVVSGTGNSYYGYTGLGSTHHIILDGIDSKHAAGAANVFVDGVSDLVYRNSTVDTWGLCYQLRSLGNSTTLTDDTCPPVAVPSAGGFVRSYSARGLIENNDFYMGWGEGGVDCGNGASHIIYRGNRHYGSTSVAQYMDGCSDTVVENAIIVGGDDFGLVGAGNTGPGINGTLAGGIGIGIEDWQGANAHNANNNLVRNNLIVRPAVCYPWGLGTTPDNGGRTMGVRLHGNTCIAANGPDMDLWYETSGNDLQVLDITSNLWWNQTYNIFNINSTTSNSNNHSYTARSTNGGASASTGNPQLVTAYAAFSAFKGPSAWPVFTDVRPSPGSPLINTGLDQCNVSDLLSWSAFGFAALEMAGFKADTSGTFAAKWVKPRCFSANGELLDSTPPIGAMCAAAGC